MSNLSSCVSTTTAVSRSGRIRSNARSGPSTTVKSTARSSPCASESNVSVSVNLGARSICALDQSELSSIQALEEDVDLAAAREADAERLIVGDAVAEQPRLARDDHLLRLDCDVALDTAAGDRPAHLSSLRDRELRADGTRRRAPRPHPSLYALSDSPIRVPPDQSSTRLEAAASAASALRVASSGVRRVSRVPNAKVSTPRPEPRAACR